MPTGYPIDKVNATLQTDAIMNDNTPVAPQFAAISASTNGNNTLIAAVSGKKIRVLSMVLISASECTATLQDGASGTGLSGAMTLVTGSGVVLPFNPIGWFTGSTNTLLNLALSAAVQVSGFITYIAL